VFAYFKRRKYEKALLGTLYGILYFYPNGTNRILVDYPGVRDAIKSNRENGNSAQKAGVYIAASLLANVLESVGPDQLPALRQQVSTLDLEQFKAMLRAHMAGKTPAFPEGMLFGTILVGSAVLVAEGSLRDKEIDDDDYKMFLSEVTGALQGKSSDERSRERSVEAIDTLAPTLQEGSQDNTRVLPSRRDLTEIDPQLSGSETRVRLMSTPTGIVLLREDDGKQVTERRALKQEDLEKIPRDLDSYTFVNVNTRTGENVSCIVAGSESEVYGSQRAFWWSLARVNVKITAAKANDKPMTEMALARVHAEARTLWDVAVDRAGSIEDMRDTFVLMKLQHFDVATKIIEQSDSEAGRLGLEIARAMILATQSEDEKLEAYAFRQFRRFLWQPGEEPQEFVMHQDRRPPELRQG
jgi:hypothetical protein